MSRWCATTGALTVFLKEHEDAGKVVRMCMALPLLPARLIVEGYNQVRAHAEALPEPSANTLRPFLDYVHNTWITGKLRTGVSVPLLQFLGFMLNKSYDSFFLKIHVMRYDCLREAIKTFA
jgi:hypothetical protein